MCDYRTVAVREDRLIVHITVLNSFNTITFIKINFSARIALKIKKYHLTKVIIPFVSIIKGKDIAVLKINIFLSTRLSYIIYIFPSCNYKVFATCLWFKISLVKLKFWQTGETLVIVKPVHVTLSHRLDWKRTRYDQCRYILACFYKRSIHWICCRKVN